MWCDSWLACGDLEIAETLVFNEFFCNYPSSGLKRSRQRFILCAEDTSTPNRFSNQRHHGGFGAQRVTGHSRQRLQRDRGMISIEFRVGRLLGVRRHPQCGRAMDGRYSKGRVEEGFQENAREIGTDTLRVDLGS